MAYRTEQEEFWSGEFGDAYIERNQNKQIAAANTALFSEVMKLTDHVPLPDTQKRNRSVRYPPLSG